MGTPASTADATSPEARAGAAGPSPRTRRIVLGVSLLVGAGVGSAIALLPGTKSASPTVASPRLGVPAVSWPAGARRAPDFRLRDQDGRPVSLGALRGRLVIVTFVDPLCRNLCPLEASAISKAARGLPPAARPAIVAVSVNPWGDAISNLRVDAQKWHLLPGWRWGLGTEARLARVWRGYQIAVRVRRKVIAGAVVREIDHTEAAFVIDRQGFQRALYLYPFRPADVAETLRRLQ